MAEHHGIRPVEAKTLTNADHLRKLLSELEKEIGRLGYSKPEQALRIPPLFDQANALVETINEKGVHVMGEAGQLTSLLNTFHSNGKPFIKSIGGTAALKAARAEIHPPEDHWWWYVDHILAEQRQQNLRRTLHGMGIAILLLGIFVLIYNLFLAPDEETVARYERQAAAEDLVSNGNYESALTEIEHGLQLLPNDPELLLYKGFLEERLGNAEAAQEAYTESLQGLPDEETFLVRRIQLYGLTEDTEVILARAEELIEKYPETGYGYFYKAVALENMGNLLEATEYYDQASAVAMEADEIQLSAIARVSLANLQMRIEVPQQTDQSSSP
ncbi:MAG: hypothetical protein JXB38_09880 [Anaerolineales bacterium]|nr:hypothetical protein [Anaerolineales bacterium]